MVDNLIVMEIFHTSDEDICDMLPNENIKPELFFRDVISQLKS